MTRVAVVTGAAHSIGAATVRGLAGLGFARGGPVRLRPGANLLDSRSELDQVVVGASAGAGVPAAVPALAAGVRDVVAMAPAVKEAERLWGGLDAAVAVAGMIAGRVPMWRCLFERMEASSAPTSAAYNAGSVAARMPPAVQGSSGIIGPLEGLLAAAGGPSFAGRQVDRRPESKRL
jgi:NAD(P)-dependent dehydrogenase (short-subunit alcohol dehydrogenase family)